MLDIRAIREDAEAVKARLSVRAKAYGAEIDRALALDTERRAIIGEVEQKKALQNAESKQVTARKKAGEDVAPIFAEMKRLGEQIKALDARLAEADRALSELLLSVPNPPNEQVPAGADDRENREIKRVGEPRAFDFAPKAHWELGAALGILDPDTAAKVTGARFHFYHGIGARLERAVINFFLDTHGENGYTEVFPPFLVNRASMTGTGQLPKFEEDAFRCEREDLFLIPTAEVPVTNMHRDEILDASALPRSYCAYSACFRAEAGSAGRDTRGLIRQHQFNKVELVKLCAPETSYEELESLTCAAERVLEALGLPYRRVLLCGGDLGFASAMTYDLEVWMPSYDRYVEISSCSNFEAFQARRANIRFRAEPGAKPQFVHTLNGSGVAAGRAVAAILENEQQRDGSIAIPAVLRPYMGGQERIGG